MKKLLKRISSSLFPRAELGIRAYSSLVRQEESYLRTTGWLQSLNHGRPVDAGNSPVPWMNYGIIAFLKDRLHKGLDLFEFGSGYSTAFYAGRVRSVTSVESDPEWLEEAKELVSRPAEFILREADVDGEYCRVAASTGRADTRIIVDGRDRVNCVKQSLAALRECGVIILDDSERKKYREAREFLSRRGFREISFEGLKPTSSWLSRATVFYRDGNCLGI